MKRETTEIRMKYQIISVVNNGRELFDITIRNNETLEVVIADQVKIWDEDQEALEEMFEAVASGEWWSVSGWHDFYLIP